MNQLVDIEETVGKSSLKNETEYFKCFDKDKLYKTSFNFCGKTVTLESGRMARQADSAVLVSSGDTRILVSVVVSKDVDTDKDFLPLSVNYREMMYACGKIPGGFY